MPSVPSSLLARSGQGEAHYCVCRDRVNLRFKGRWFRFEAGNLSGFRQVLGRLLGEEPLVHRLIDEARTHASERGQSPACLPTVGDLHEMLALVDTALLVLEAQEIIRRA